MTVALDSTAVQIYETIVLTLFDHQGLCGASAALRKNAGWARPWVGHLGQQIGLLETREGSLVHFGLTIHR